MKRLSILLLLIVITSATVMSQPFRKPKHVLLIRNLRTCKILKVTENSDVSVKSSAGREISGRVKRVSGDTVFFGETFIRTPEIQSIAFNRMQSMPSFPERMPGASQNRRYEYSAGSPDYQLVCPPDSVYENQWTYTIYFKKLSYETKTAHQKTMNPLHETRNPLGEKVKTDTAFMPGDTGNLLNNDMVRPSGRAKMQYYKNFLKWNMTKLAHLEIAFSYERLIAANLTWETELSAIFGVQSADAYYTISMPLYNYNGFSVTTYPKYYITRSTMYLGVVFMYRYLWANEIRSAWPGNHDNGVLQDQYRNDFGLSLRIGTMKRYGNFVVDFYFGGGIKVIMLHQLAYGNYLYHDSGQTHWYNDDHSPIVSDQVLLGPVINAGIKIGVAF